ncbi:AMP-binding protein [Pantoea stewartii]|uniref:AMP-binding protein n=1 Tax=Pantoea stewartii TaxID=66269 RepID=UPI001624F5EC|nr:AMP-binding protein [Pantoea stewartii]MBC0856494.1 AMP-binding protein [Pantoea stewartii]
MNILEQFVLQAQRSPHAAAIIQLRQADNGHFEEEVRCSYQTLLKEANHLAAYLKSLIGTRAQVGIVMGNTPEWVLADIALLLADLIEVPVPLAFSGEQAAFLLQNCQAVLTDTTGEHRLAEWQANGLQLQSVVLPLTLGEIPSHDESVVIRPADSAQDGVIKIIHTSGTTSQPKGVMIRRHGLDALVESLWQRAQPNDYQRYLNLVPLSLLIEQVTALYMPLTSGGAVVMPPADMPPLGHPGVIAAQRLSIICAARPSAMTLTPAMVEALAERAVSHGNRPGLIVALFGQDEAPLLAAGGAPVTAEVLQALNDCGIPVYQGYGLSENSSVVTWNARGDNRIGTVGKPLSHVEVKIADDGELCLRSSSFFAGYSSEDPSSCTIDDEGWLHTGDLATQDVDGFISIVGRKKTLIITANGRNISPEWLESAYRTIPGVLQVIVYGDRQQFLGGLFMVDDMCKASGIRQAIASYAREHLSEIEFIPEPVLVPHSVEIMAQLFTVTGRPRRSAVKAFLAQHEAMSA